MQFVECFYLWLYEYATVWRDFLDFSSNSGIAFVKTIRVKCNAAVARDMMQTPNNYPSVHPGATEDLPISYWGRILIEILFYTSAFFLIFMIFFRKFETQNDGEVICYCTLMKHMDIFCCMFDCRHWVRIVFKVAFDF